MIGSPPPVVQVLAQVKAAWDRGVYEPLASDLDRFNNLGCPLIVSGLGLKSLER